MNRKFGRFSIRNVTDYMAVLMIILSSGSLFFTILNLKFTLGILLICSFGVLLIKQTEDRIIIRNLSIFFGIMAVVILNLCFNFQYSVFNKDFFILLIRLFSLCLIQSCVTKDQFVKCYINIMVVLAVLSLVCFFCTMFLDAPLPFMTQTGKNNVTYIYTFYHTMGCQNIYKRNAGIFWEAPAYAIFINMAILFLVYNVKLFSQRKIVLYYIILSITLLTTLSVFAFFCYGLIVALFLIHLNSKNIKQWKKNVAFNSKYSILKLKRYFYVLGTTAVFALLLVEGKYRIITHKLINKGGSFTTRTNDTLYSIKMVINRIFTGYGIFNNYTVGALKEYGVINNSNGYMTLLIAVGLPLFIIITGYFLYRIKKFFDPKGVEIIIISVIFLLFYSSEHLWLYTVFLSFLFTWQMDEKNKIQQVSPCFVA